MRVVVIGLGEQQPAAAYASTLESPILARERHHAGRWIGGTGHEPRYLDDVVESDCPERVGAQLLSIFRTIAADHESATYLVPGIGTIGDQTVQLLGTEFDLIPYAGSISSKSPLGNATIVDALTLAIAEQGYPFDAGQVALSPANDTLVTNFRGQRVRELAGRRLQRLLVNDAEALGQECLRYRAVEDPQATPGFDGLERIVSILRSPGGCPWDREQTIDSLLPQMEEELTEFREALAGESGAEQADELGDVLLHIVMMAQIARESGAFSISDVVRAISGKMVRRHPHVFGDVQVESIQDIHDVWNDVKQREQAEKARTLDSTG